MAPFQFKIPQDTGDPKAHLISSIFESDFQKHLLEDEPKSALLPFLRTVEVVSVERTSETTARAVYRFKVLHEYLNPTNTLHGGMSGGLYDTATTWTLDAIRKPGFWQHFGVSRSLNITFLRPAAEGEVLVMESEIVHAGKRLCLIKAVLKRERDGAVVSTCEHQKYNTDADLAKA